MVPIQITSRKLNYIKYLNLIFCDFAMGGAMAPMALPLDPPLPNTAQILCRSFTTKRHRQLQVKNLPKAHTWLLGLDSNPRLFGRKGSNLPMSHLAPCR